uniref:Protein tyrosine phosphatase type IVA 3 n=1 Tax=Gadus morhua TaxID=8049 RepID=A0A8C5FRC6_GADMO
KPVSPWPSPEMTPNDNYVLVFLLQDLMAFGVRTLVRVCTATYNKAPVEQAGKQVLDWPFDDGSAPPDQVVVDWLCLLKTKFREEPGGCVPVRCVAGLGAVSRRTCPYIHVSLATIFCRAKAKDHNFKKRHVPFNSKQLLYLENYQPKLFISIRNGRCINCVN